MGRWIERQRWIGRGTEEDEDRWTEEDEDRERVENRLDDALAHALVLVGIKVAEDVAALVLKDLKRHAAVVVLQRRDVVVA